MTLDEFHLAKENFNSVLIMSEFGGGKSTQLAIMCRMLFETYGYKSLLMLCDQGSGNGPYIDQGLVDECGMKIISLHDTKHPVKVMASISKGFWPEYEEINDDIKLVVRENSTYKINFDEYQILVSDSFTGNGEYLGEYYSDPTQSIGFKLGATAKDDDYEYGTMQMGHYQLAHKQLQQFYSMYVPRLPLRYFLVSAQIEETKRAYVPSIMGKALNFKIGGWFRNTFHITNEVVSVETIRKQKLEKEYGITTDSEDSELIEAKVAWFREHKNSITGLPYLIKPRIPVQLLDIVNSRYPEGYQVLDTSKGLLRFFDFMKQADDLIKQKKKG